MNNAADHSGVLQAKTVTNPGQLQLPRWLSAVQWLFKGDTAGAQWSAMRR